MQERGDGGSYLRTAMEAMALAGVCPERYWPYDPRRLDDEPPAFCYAVADNYEAMVYYRLDHAGQDPAALLRSLKTHLARGLPVIGDQLCQQHCPVSHVAHEFPELCEAETEAISRALGTHVARLATIAHGDGVCTTCIPSAHHTDDHRKGTSA